MPKVKAPEPVSPPQQLPADEDFNKVDLESKRAIAHVGVLLLALFLTIILPVKTTRFIACSAIPFFIIFEIIRLYSQGFNKFIITYCNWGYRQSENNKKSSLIDGSVSIPVAYLLFPSPVFQATLLMLAFSDPTARVFGRLFGKRKIRFCNGKTYIGSFSFFLTALAIAIFYFSWHLALIGAAIATLAELGARRKYYLDDNMLIPLVPGIVLSLLI